MQNDGFFYETMMIYVYIAGAKYEQKKFLGSVDTAMVSAVTDLNWTEPTSQQLDQLGALPELFKKRMNFPLKNDVFLFLKPHMIFRFT